MSKEHSIPSTKINFTLKSEKTTYDFTLINKGEELTFKFENLKEFPIKLYGLKIQFEKLKETDENLVMFKNAEMFIKRLKTFIQHENYGVQFDEEENVIIFIIKNEIFENGVAKIKIPEQEQDLEVQVESLTKTVSELRKELLAIKIKETEKEDTAVKSFEGTSFLKDDEKILISKWIHPNRVIRFNLLFNTDKDGDSSSTFHYYCDAIYPTVIVIFDTQGRRFGGYCTQNWTQHSSGGSSARAVGSFLFSLNNKKKFELINQFNTTAIAKNNSYGPMFGGGYDLILYNGCKSNGSSYCNKSTYNSGDTNILGEKGQTYFQVKTYEVYQVIFE